MKWQKIAWCDEAELMLEGALLSDTEIIKAEVNSGVSSLWEIPHHGFFITRLEAIDDKKELVLVAWSGKNTNPIIQYLKNVCESLKIQSMRFHTFHNEKLINRFVRRWNFCAVERRQDETIYRLEVL